MKSIWKYEVPVDGRAHARPMPIGARIVHVGLSALSDGGGVTFWAEVDPNAPQGQRTFRVVGTGHTVHKGETYVGTFARATSAFVWHLYEVTS